MIARIWHGAVPVGKSEAYLEKMRTVALPGYRNVEGNQGAWVMHRIEGDIAHFDMLTFGMMSTRSSGLPAKTIRSHTISISTMIS